MIAALFVETNGVYFNRPDVDPWDEQRDARKYAGPHPVVAHPPCNRWCKPLAFVNQTRYGHRVGDDGGCFAAALRHVRDFGGVLEQPANSAAFDAFILPRPKRGGWMAAPGGWVCSVFQRAYGHPARKQTWLYATGAKPGDLDWSNPEPIAQVSWLRRRSRDLPRLTRKAASASPSAFVEALLGIAMAAR